MILMISESGTFLISCIVIGAVCISVLYAIFRQDNPPDPPDREPTRYNYPKKSKP